MTEGVLSRSPGRPLIHRPMGGGFNRIHATALSRRYAGACRRARNAAKWQRFFNAFSDRLKVLENAFIPLFYFLVRVRLLAVFGAVTASSAVGLRTQVLHERIGDLTAWRPKPLHLRRHMRLNTFLAFIFTGVSIFTAVFYTPGLEVFIDGESMGYVTTQSQFYGAVENVSERVGDILGTPYSLSPNVTFKINIARRSVVYDPLAVENKLFSQVDAITLMHVLVIDGYTVGGCIKRDDISNVLDEILSQYPPAMGYDSVSFAQDVKIQYRYADSNLLKTAADIGSILSSELRPAVYDTLNEGETIEEFCERHIITIEKFELLNKGIDLLNITADTPLLVKASVPYLSVAMDHITSYETVIPYETTYIEDKNLFVDESKIVQKGVNGAVLITANQQVLDGTVVGENIINSLVTLEPVGEIIAKGTRVRYSLGTFVRPLAGSITSGFGYRKFSGSREFHSGIDIANKKGTSIMASDGGKVIFAGWSGNYGNMVIIEHNSTYKTVYAHCDKLLVKAGQMVGQKEVIAKVGTTGRSTGYHLHFEIRKNGQHVNPLNYIKN